MRHLSCNSIFHHIYETTNDEIGIILSKAYALDNITILELNVKNLKFFQGKYKIFNIDKFNT